MNKAEDQLLVIFGASGDLTGRKLLPSLAELHARGWLPERFAVLGAARTVYDDDSYRRFRKDGAGKALPDDFLRRVHYQPFDPDDPESYAALRLRIESLRREASLPDRIVYYLATPPSLYEIVPRGLQAQGLAAATEPGGWRRIVVEKPFGSDLASARRLDEVLRGIFDERDIYRIDHYLGKETVQNILVLRFSNGIFEPLWNRNYIDRIEIGATETLGVEKRGGYYDRAGAMRDMIQNHLMHLMAFVAMEAPSSFEPEPLRDEIVKVFRSLRPYSLADMRRNIVRGQYEGYRQEAGVAPDSTTETCVAMRFYIDNWRWAGVPFYFFTGKKLSRKESLITVHFKSTPQKFFAGQCSGSSCNKLSVRIQPDESIALSFGLKTPGAGFRVRQVGMDFRYASLSGDGLPGAYERLLFDAMTGDSTLYARSDALEESWKFVEPVSEYWRRQGADGLSPYAAGSDGPAQAAGLFGERTPSRCECAEADRELRAAEEES